MDIKLDLIIASRIYREGIASYFSELDGVSICEMYDSVVSVLTESETCKGDVLIIDTNLTDVRSLIVCLKRKETSQKIILMMFSNQESLINEYLEAGVEGFISNSDSMEDLNHCISLVHRGHCCYPKELANYALAPDKKSAHLVVRNGSSEVNLTSQQTRIVQLIEEGLSNKEIARKLGIQLATVKNHVHQILDRLEVKNRCEAASVYRRVNTVHPPVF